MNSNAFSAADMTTAAANGHRDGYQAGYADAVKAFELGAAQEAVAWQVGDDFYTSESLAIEGIQQWGPSGSIAIPLYAAPVAAAQEAVAYLDIGAGGYLDLYSNLPEVQLSALPKGRHALGIIGTYGIDGYVAAPVAAAPAVDVATLRALADRWANDRSYTGSPVDGIRALIEQPTASTPAAPGIDLRNAILQLREDALHMKDPGDTVNAYDRVLRLIDASPKGVSPVVTDVMVNAALRVQYARAGSVWTGTEVNPDFVDMRHILTAAMQAASAEVGECRCRPGRYGCEPDCPSQQPTSHGAGVSE